VHVALSKRIFRLNQCVFSIVLSYWQNDANFNRGRRTISGQSGTNPESLKSSRWMSTGAKSACSIPINAPDTDGKVEQELLRHAGIRTTMNICPRLYLDGCEGRGLNAW
jgi:hypothetical protein